LFSLAFATPPSWTTTTAAPLSSTPQTCLTAVGLTCLQVTDAASFVACNTTSKKCYCLPTFDGNASPASHCQCPAGKDVYFPSFPLGGGVFSDSTWVPANWGFGDPICIDLDNLLALKAADTKNQQHVSYVMQFFNNTIGTTPAGILATGGVPQLQKILAPNVRSRISPAGEFDGFEGVVEYFYGFVASGSLVVTNVNVREVAATGQTVGIKADLWLHNFASAFTNNHPPEFWNLTTFAFFTFDQNDQISSIDVSVPNLGVLLDVPANDTVTRARLIQTTCVMLTTADPTLNGNKPGGFCGALNVFNGGSNYTAQLQDCIFFYTTQIPWGTRDRNNANSFSCRQLHSILTPYRPAIHCPHAGRTGGDACIDMPYANYYLQDF